MRQHFTTEDFGVKLPHAAIESDDVNRARQLLTNTTRRVGERFETGLLWKTDEVILPDSYAMALQRLKGIERKMSRDAEFGKQYRNQIDTYVKKGYAREMSEEASAQRSHLVLAAFRNHKHSQTK